MPPKLPTINTMNFWTRKRHRTYLHPRNRPRPTAQSPANTTKCRKNYEKNGKTKNTTTTEKKTTPQRRNEKPNKHVVTRTTQESQPKKRTNHAINAEAGPKAQTRDTTTDARKKTPESPKNDDPEVRLYLPRWRYTPITENYGTVNVSTADNGPRSPLRVAQNAVAYIAEPDVNPIVDKTNGLLVNVPNNAGKSAGLVIGVAET